MCRLPIRFPILLSRSLVPAADARRQKNELRDDARKAVCKMRPGDIGGLEGAGGSLSSVDLLIWLKSKQGDTRSLIRCRHSGETNV